MKEILDILMRIVLTGGVTFALVAMIGAMLIILGRAIHPPENENEIIMRIIMGFMGCAIGIFNIMLCLGLYTLLFHWQEVLQRMVA